MAQRKFFVDLNLNQNQLVSARFEKTTTKASVDGIEAQVYYNEDTKKVMIHNGTDWVSIAPDIEAMRFKGGRDITAAPPTAISGDTYVVTVGGTPEGTWVFDPADTGVQAGDIIIYNASDSKWVVVQRNIDASSESAPGFIQIATTGEIDAKTDNTKAVTPAKLAAAQEKFRQDENLVRTFVDPNKSIGSAGTVITHNLNTLDIHVSVYDANDNIIDVEVTTNSANLNVVTLKSNVTVVANRVVVFGYRKP